MSISELNKRAYAYLGIHGECADNEIVRAVGSCLEELEKIARFRYAYKFFPDPPEFLNKDCYAEYLKGSRGVILAVMTLGADVDRRIKYYGKADAGRSVVFDACASAYLEYLADGYESGIGEKLSYRFCPGYGGSDAGDARYIFDLLKGEKIGMTLTDTGYMLPSKSMAGIIAVGGSAVKNCLNCVAFSQCKFRKEGVTCYGWEKK